MKVVISKCEKVERRVLAVEEQEIFLGYLARTKRESVKWVDYDGNVSLSFLMLVIRWIVCYYIQYKYWNAFQSENGKEKRQ